MYVSVCMYVCVYIYTHLCVCVSLKFRVDKYICRISVLATGKFPVQNTFYMSDTHISTKPVAH